METSDKETVTDREQLEKEHSHGQVLLGGYTAFVAALFVAALTMGDSNAHIRIAGSLLAVSLPSLVAILFLDYTVRVRQGRKGSAARGLALFLGLTPSLVGIVLLIWHVSAVAAICFVALTIYWILRHDRIVYLNPGKDSHM